MAPARQASTIPSPVAPEGAVETGNDLLQEIQATDPSLAKKVYLLEDCTSAVVIPGVVDFSEQAEAAFARFAEAGMHRVRSTDPIREWPEFPL